MLSDFKWRRFQSDVILWAVRWYCRCGIRYRDLEQVMSEHGVPVDHYTIYRWVQKYAPEIEERLRWHWRRPQSTSWRVDETYLKFRGQWTYLYRAVDKFGNTINFYLSPTRNAKAAKRFLGKALNGLKDWKKPHVINTDKATTYGISIAQLRGDIAKRIHRALSEQGIERGLDDEFRGTAFAVVDGVEDHTHHTRLPDIEAAGDSAPGSIVELRSFEEARHAGLMFDRARP